MTEIVEHSISLPAMSVEQIDKVRRAEAVLLGMPQVEIEMTHQLHAGMYLRTAHLPKNVVANGVLVTIPTVLIISGHVTVYLGDESVDICGYHVLTAQPGRKQAFVTHADTDMTMCFATSATSVEEAENEFTNEPELLMSRKHSEEFIEGETS